MTRSLPRRPLGKRGAGRATCRNPGSVSRSSGRAVDRRWAPVGVVAHHPLIRRIRAPKGQRPLAPVARRYQWIYVYGFVRPDTGKSWWCLLPTVSLAAMQVTLAAVARDEGIDTEHPAALVVDNAGWHHSPSWGCTGSSCHPPVRSCNRPSDYGHWSMRSSPTGSSLTSGRWRTRWSLAANSWKRNPTASSARPLPLVARPATPRVHEVTRISPY